MRCLKTSTASIIWMVLCTAMATSAFAVTNHQRGFEKRETDSIVRAGVLFLSRGKPAACLVSRAVGTDGTHLAGLLKRAHVKVLRSRSPVPHRQRFSIAFIEILKLRRLSSKRALLMSYSPGRLGDDTARDIWSSIYLDYVAGRWVVDKRSTSYVENIPST
jgi:hypothetical protein